MPSPQCAISATASVANCTFSESHKHPRRIDNFHHNFIDKMILIFFVLSLACIGQGFKMSRLSQLETSFFPRQNWNSIRGLPNERVYINNYICKYVICTITPCLLSILGGCLAACDPANLPFDSWEPGGGGYQPWPRQWEREHCPWRLQGQRQGSSI